MPKYIYEYKNNIHKHRYKIFFPEFIYEETINHSKNASSNTFLLVESAIVKK